MQQSEAAIEVARAQLELARLNLSYTVIIATADGVLGRKEIHEGQLVQPGQTMVDIVDSRDLWVVANYRETQLPRIAVGAKVRIKADAVPNVEYAGTVERISDATGSAYSLIPQDNATGNFVKVELRVPVRINLDSNKPAYFEPRMWAYRHLVPIILLIAVVEGLLASEHVLEEVFYEEVMDYEMLTSRNLTLWALPGMWMGCLVSWLWLKVWRFNVYKLIAIGLLSVTLYASGFYFLVADHINIEVLRLPLMFRGFGYATLSIAFMWSLHEIKTFEQFFQSLSVFNFMHMYIGGVIGCALYAWGLRYYMADNILRYTAYLDMPAFTSAPFDVGEWMEDFIPSMMAVTIKQLYGWVLYIAGALAIAFLLWDIPTVRHIVRRFPTWPVVGARLLTTPYQKKKIDKGRLRPNSSFVKSQKIKIMTKTVEMQIEKTRGLIKGLRKHLNETGRGATSQELDSMEQTVDALVTVCEECDRLRAELVPKVKRMNEILGNVKADYANHKLIIKNNYPQERWTDYGVPDKR